MGKRKRKKTALPGRQEYGAIVGTLVPPRAATDGTRTPATPNSASALPAVWACADTITATVLQVPLRAHTAGRTEPLPEWLRKCERWNDNVADLYAITESLTIGQALYGSGYLWAEPSGPAAWRLYPIDAPRVTVAFDQPSSNRPRRRIYSIDGRTVPLARRYTTRASKAGLLPVPHRTMHEHAAGVGPIQAARLSFGSYIETEGYGSEIYGDGVPAGILKSDQDITPERAQYYHDEWLRNAGSPIRVIGNGFAFESLRLNPRDAAWLDARRFDGEEIARMFLVPAYKLNLAVSGGLTYNNPESLERDFIRSCIASYLSPIERALNSLTPAGRNADEEMRIVFDYSGLMRATTSERYNAYAAALTAGWMTVDEVRALEGMQPLPVSGAET